MDGHQAHQRRSLSGRGRRGPERLYRRKGQDVAALLKKRQGGYITEKEQLRLDELIDTREAIQVKYNLVPDDVDGYAKILEGIEVERARTFARGESDIDVTVYEQALTAAAQGHAAVQKALDERYAAEYAVIQLIEDEGERAAAQADLDAR